MNKIQIIIGNIIGETKYLFKGRDKSVVLFGSWFGNRFADNSRYLYQYLSENKEKHGLTHVVWVTRNQAICDELVSLGYEAYMMDSEESVHYHKIAKFHIISNGREVVGNKGADILPEYSNGAIRINLWHGIGGIKGVNFCSKEYMEAKAKQPILYTLYEIATQLRLYRLFAFLPGGWGDVYYLSTTPFATESFKKYFMLPDKFYIESGYPRNRSIYKLLKSEQEVVERVKNSKRTILYMPTFRDNNANYTAPLSDGRVVDLLKENGWTWIEKKHGADQSNLLGAVGVENVLQLPGDFDASVIMPHVDAVITDYSSASWDGLYFKKPIIFYMPDFDYYANQDRGFVLKPEEFLIGPDVYSIDELVELFQKNKEDFNQMLPENEDEIFKKVWGKEMECSEIWEDICKKVL